MRLKILFFPLMLAVSISVALLYGWPWFTELQNVKAVRNENRSKLDDIRKKSGNIEQLNSAIKSGGEDIQLIYQYLPREKREELVIDGINYIALNTTGLVLSSISVAKEEAGGNAPADASELGGPAAGASEAAPSAPSGSGNNLKYVTAEVSVAGTYETIRTFLDRLDGMQFYNSVKNVEIGHVSKEGELQEEGGDAVAASDGMLTANLDVEFGYMSALSSGSGTKSGIFDKDKFDLSATEQLRNNAQIKIPEMKLGSPAGKENPFTL